MPPTALADRPNVGARTRWGLLTDSKLIYFSSVSENTKRFVDKLEMDVA